MERRGEEFELRAETDEEAVVAFAGADEHSRLAAVQHYNLRDLVSDGRFTRICQLAADLSEHSYAAITIIDANESWTLATVGGPMFTIPRRLSLCQRSLDVGMDLVIAERLLDDARFWDLIPLPAPLAAATGFYASTQLRTPDGHTIGMLCLFDTVPGTLNEKQRSALLELGATVVEAMELRVSARRLRDSEARQQVIIGSMGSAVVTIDPNGNIPEAPVGVETLFGYSGAELIGKPVSVLFAETETTSVDALMQGLLPVRHLTSPTRERLVQVRRKNGTTFAADLTLNECKLGERFFVTGIFRDATARIRDEEALRDHIRRLKFTEGELESSRQLLMTAIENIRDGFVLYDKDDRLVLANSKIHDLYKGWDFEMTIGHTFEELTRRLAYAGIYPNAAGREEEWVAGRLASHTLPDELREEEMADGRRLQVSERPMPGGGRVGIRTDITELRRAEEAAQTASRAKSEFLSVMSHELRTPLNAILGFAQLLMSGRGDPLTPRQAGQVGHILEAGRHLLQLINEVLDLSRVEAGGRLLALESIDTIAMVGECISAAEAMVGDRDVKIINALPTSLPMIRADYTRGRQVVLNLLSNAVKYNRPGGTVTISADIRPDRRVRLLVADTGIGISEENQARAFEPFNRLGASTEIEGTGIGLTLTRTLMERMGGSIGLFSELGQGSTFWLDFPMDRPESGEDEDAIGLHPSSEPGMASLGLPKSLRQVLYVEDNPANVKLVSDFLNDIGGIEVLAARTVDLGLALARDRRPDLIVMDVHLPGIGGLAAMQILRADPRTTDIPVIALCADEADIAMQHGSDNGSTLFLRKPLVLADLLAAVRRLTWVPAASLEATAAPLRQERGV